jgi:membrane-bound lytic murein transglycosylase F
LKLEKVPQLVWKSVKGASTEALLYGVWQKEFDCTVADSNILALNRRFMPELTSPLVVGQTQHLAWMLPQGALKLQSAVNEWLDAFRSSGALAQWHDHYYGFIEEYDYVDNKKLHDRVPSRYKPHAHLFETAAEKYDLSLTLLAAQSYQESHWRPKAKSPTGVRGMMMLTRVTAKSMGVTDRLDAAQSIDGGARYLKAMKARFSENVVEPDRTWMALAAYNIGRAHLHDAQRLARERGLSPYKWSDIQTILPLLSQPDVYKKLKYGYARGHEPVQYVRRIREYEHVLKRLLSQDT